MNRVIKKGTRMVYWSIEFGTRGGYWVIPDFYGLRPCLTKKHLMNFLRKFHVSDWPQWDIISVKILRFKRLGQSSQWKSEVMGYTDVNDNGNLYNIKL